MLGLAGLLLGLQLSRRSLKPFPARDRISQLRRQLITARVPVELILGPIDRVRLPQDRLDLGPDRGYLRFALKLAFARIFVPSIATRPTFTIPALAHNANTCTNNPANAPACRFRNRAIVE